MLNKKNQINNIKTKSIPSFSGGLNTPQKLGGHVKSNFIPIDEYAITSGNTITCSLKMLTQTIEDREDILSIDSIPLNQAVIVGRVTNVFFKNTKTRFGDIHYIEVEINDDSSQIAIQVYKRELQTQDSDKNQEQQERDNTFCPIQSLLARQGYENGNPVDIMPGWYIRAVIRPKKNESEKYWKFAVLGIQKIEDFNEITHHTLRIIAEHMMRARGLLPVEQLIGYQMKKQKQQQQKDKDQKEKIKQRQEKEKLQQQQLQEEKQSQSQKENLQEVQIQNIQNNDFEEEIQEKKVINNNENLEIKEIIDPNDKKMQIEEEEEKTFKLEKQSQEIKNDNNDKIIELQEQNKEKNSVSKELDNLKINQQQRKVPDFSLMEEEDNSDSSEFHIQQYPSNKISELIDKECINKDNQNIESNNDNNQNQKKVEEKIQKNINGNENTKNNNIQENNFSEQNLISGNQNQIQNNQNNEKIRVQQDFLLTQEEEEEIQVEQQKQEDKQFLENFKKQNDIQSEIEESSESEDIQDLILEQLKKPKNNFDKLENNEKQQIFENSNQDCKNNLEKQQEIVQIDRQMDSQKENILPETQNKENNNNQKQNFLNVSFLNTTQDDLEENINFSDIIKNNNNKNGGQQ